MADFPIRYRTFDRDSLEHGFIRYLLIYLAAWLGLLAAFAYVAYPALEGVLLDQTGKRMEGNAAVLDQYLSSVGSFSDSTRDRLDLLCKELNRPHRLDAWLTIFSRKQEVLADSKVANPLEERMRPRPEVRAALEKSIGSDIRYSPTARRRMAFFAYPHVKLGTVKGVIRLGIPCSSLERPLWLAFAKIAVAGAGMAFVAAVVTTLVRQVRPEADADWHGDHRP